MSALRDLLFSGLPSIDRGPRMLVLDVDAAVTEITATLAIPPTPDMRLRETVGRYVIAVTRRLPADELSDAYEAMYDALSAPPESK